MEVKQGDNQQKMMIFDELLQFIGVNQNEISNEIFERTNEIEKKHEYHYMEHRLPILFRVEIQPQKRKNIVKVSISNETQSTLNKTKREERPKIRTYEERNEYKPLDSSLEVFFGNQMNNYQWIDYKYRNRNFVYTYFHSFFSIFDDMFIHKSEIEKTTIIKDCLKKMLEELYIEGNYQKYYYHKNRKFKKEWIQTTLNHALLLNQKVNAEHFYIIQQYISDYFGVNTFVISLLEDGNIDFDKNECYCTKQYGGIINPYIPHLFILKKGEIYYPIIGNSSIDNYLLYRVQKDIVDKVYSYYNLNKMYEIMFERNHETEEQNVEMIEESGAGRERERNVSLISYSTLSITQLRNKKIVELHEMANELHISIYKKSEKTGKDIKKTKDELLQDISKIIYSSSNESECESPSCS
jgi:hypothetical protein